MKKLLTFVGIGMLCASAAGCALFEGGTRDPIAIGRAIGAVSCTVAVTEKPELKPVLAATFVDVLDVLNSPTPSLAAIGVALAKVEDPKVRAYASGTIAIVLAVFPNLPANADEALPTQAIDGLKAALVACGPIVGPAPTTTSTSSTTTTTL
jgi:hypothetical protein